MANISLINTSYKIHNTCNTYFSNSRVRNINVTNILGISPPMLPDEQASECSAPGRITNITDTAVAAWLTGRSTKSRLGVRRYKHCSRCMRSSSLVHISAATPCILIRRSVTECQQGELGGKWVKIGWHGWRVINETITNSVGILSTCGWQLFTKKIYIADRLRFIGIWSSRFFYLPSLGCGGRTMHVLARRERSNATEEIS